MNSRCRDESDFLFCNSMLDDAHRARPVLQLTTYLRSSREHHAVQFP